MKVENVTIETIKLENQGLKQTTGYWLKISKGDKEFTMSVGETTYNNVQSLERTDAARLTVTEPNKKINGK